MESNRNEINIPKLRSVSSPNLTPQSSSPQLPNNNTSNSSQLYSTFYPKASPSHIFFTSSSSTTNTTSSSTSSSSTSRFEPKKKLTSGEEFELEEDEEEENENENQLKSVNPIEVLSGRKTPFYMPTSSRSNTTTTNNSSTTTPNRTHSSSLGGGDSGGMSEYWSSPQSNSTRQWTSPATSFNQTNTPASNQSNNEKGNLNENSSKYQLGLSHLLQTSFDLNNQLTILTGVVQGLTTKVASLEHDQQTSSDEILQLRLILQSHHSSYSTSSPLNLNIHRGGGIGIPHSNSYLNLNSHLNHNNNTTSPNNNNNSNQTTTTTSNLVSPSNSFSDLTQPSPQSRRSSNPFEFESPQSNVNLPTNSTSSTSSSGIRYQFPLNNNNNNNSQTFSIPNLPPLSSSSNSSLRAIHESLISPTKPRGDLMLDTLSPIDQIQQLYSSGNNGSNNNGNYFDDLSNSPSGSYISKRRSRGSSEGLRARGLSITPVIAQAKWLSQQQNVGGMIPEPINYRTLLEQDIDVDAEIFVRRILMQNDQQCSLYLQQRIKNASSEERRIPVYTAVRKHLFELSLNKFGNFLVSRCLEYGGMELTLDFTSIFIGNILQLSTDPFGCHICQKLLDCGDQGTKDLVINELLPHIATLTQKNSGHVWSKLLATPNSPSFYRRLSEQGAGQWSSIAKDETGSLVVQSVLENWKDSIKLDGNGSDIIKDVEEDLIGVSETQWGSFVVLHLIEYGTTSFVSKALQVAERLSLDHFGAKIIERAIKRNDVSKTYTSEFVRAICRSINGERPSLVDVASHASGSQLLVVLFSGNVTTTDEKIKMIHVIKQNGNALKQTAHGEKIYSFAERR